MKLLHSFSVAPLNRHRSPIGSLSKDVFERRTSTGSEAFSLFIRLDTTKFVLLSFFSPIKTIYLRVSTKPQPNAAKSPLPVDVRRSKTLLLKLPNVLAVTGVVSIGFVSPPLGIFVAPFSSAKACSRIFFCPRLRSNVTNTQITYLKFLCRC